VAPRAQLEAAASAERADGAAAYGTTLTRLREVSERIPDGLVIDLTRLTLEGERLQLVGNAPTFETVDVLRRALVGSARLADVTTDEVRTTVDGQRVSFRVRARWVARGEASS
jgi:Tfp pilus assembly protein PilN